MNKNKIKKELEEYLSNYEGGYNHRSATRYLSKRRPTFWSEIIEATDFLPLEAKAKQRCWHILNEIYERPICPMTEVFVKWFDNRYLTYSSLSAKSSDPAIQKKMRDTYEKRTGYREWNSDPEVKERLNETFHKNREEGKHTIVPSPFGDPEIQEKIRLGFREKYGVDNPMGVKEFRQKLMDPDKDEKERYYEEIAFYTRHSWHNHYSKINPNNYKRGNEYQLDHIFSRYEGWKQNIPSEIIGHWTNLQMLEKEENRAKDIICWKTKEQLFEDYNKYTEGVLFNG